MKHGNLKLWLTAAVCAASLLSEKAAAQTSTLAPFTVSGKLAIGTCDPANPGAVKRRPLATYNYSGYQPAIANTNFTQYTLGGMVAPSITTGNTQGSYTRLLQRDVNGTLLTWGYNNTLIQYQGDTRVTGYNSGRHFGFTSPAYPNDPFRPNRILSDPTAPFLFRLHRIVIVQAVGV